MKKDTMILLAEDDLNLNMTLKEIFQEHGMIVVTTDDGKHVEDLMRRHEVDIVVCDLHMKIMGGMEVAEIIRANNKYDGVPIIIITADPFEENKILSLQKGVNDYINKPFLMQELILKIKNCSRLKSGLLETNVLESIYDHSHLQTEDQLLVRKIETYLLSHIQENVSIETLADYCFISRSSLDKKIRKFTNKSTSNYIRDFKIEIAKKMLEAGLQSIKQIANETGFSSVAYFSSSFMRHEGKSPTQYKSALAKKQTI
jgi:DNA-binding response OmpR family regulator